MRKKKRFLLASVWMCLFLLATPTAALAGNATSYTYSTSRRGFVRTQDAYLPGPVLLREAGLKTPEDICIRDGVIYVADAGNRRIVRYDLASGEYVVLAEGLLQYPTGLYVRKDGCIYVADYGAKKVLLLSMDGRLLREYLRPEEAIFGSAATYFPRKVAANSAGDVYIVSEGGYDGIINLNADGRFMGYFGFNYTRMTLWQRIQQRIFTDAQLNKVLTEKPSPFGNLDIGEDGIVYTVTPAVRGNALKRHDIAGANMIADDMVDESNFVDVCVGSFGQMYALTQTGLINEYDAAGDLLVTFGGKAIASERAGFFSVAAAIARDAQDNLYVLDRERGAVHVFCPTDFILGIHSAIRDYENGDYQSSRRLWQQVIDRGGRMEYAYQYLARTYYQTQDYANALKYAKLADSREMASDAFWEMRNTWLMRYLGYILSAFALGAMLWRVYRLLRPKPPTITLSRQSLEHTPGLRGDLKLTRRYLRHPVDTLYYIRRGECATPLSATVLYLAAFVVFFADYYFRSFIFNEHKAEEGSIILLAALFFGAIGFTVGGNYLVSSISEGEGKLRHVYIMGAYALTPVILGLPLITVMSYALTLNEAFFIEAGQTLLWLWSAVLLVIGVHEVHQFTLRRTVANVLWTLFFIAIALIVLSVLYMFWDQLSQFVYSLVKEVGYSVC